MKKFFYLAVAACTALAACSKNEVTPVDVDQQITFQAVVNKASTKALIDGNNYDTGVPFGSVAYFQSTPASLYIPLSKVSYTDGTPEGYWSTATTYYWPKTGKLTFYSYSPFSYAEDPYSEINPTVSENGLTFTDYSVKDHQETDLMVADPKKDMTASGTTSNGGTWAKGVPTIFHHMLAQIKNITFQTVDGTSAAKDYTNGHTDETWVAGDKKFVINQVDIKNFYETGTLVAGATNTWNSTVSVTDSYTYYNGTAEFGKTATSTKNTNEYYLVLPQDLTAGGQKLYIKYTIKSYNGSEWVDEEVEVTKDFKDIITDAKWEMNKKYTINIKIGLNQIYWDPKVESWEEKSFDYTVTD